MSTEQYKRKLSLIVGGDSGDALELSALRIRFDIRRGDIQTPNTARIRIYNAAPNTLNRVEKEFTRVVLQAGYEGNFGLIFDGTIIDRLYGKENNTDTYLDLTVADGDRAYNFAVMSTSLAAGSTPSDSLKAILQVMGKHGVTEGYTPDLPEKKSLRGQVFYGTAKHHMRKFARNMDCSWSIQDGKLTMIPLTAYIPGEIPVISPETGLIGMPTQTINGINMRILLNPSVKVGQLIKLKDSTVQRYQFGTGIADVKARATHQPENKLNAEGLYYVMACDSKGDTRGQDWYSDLTCLAADATVISDEYARRAVVAPADIIKRFG